jgi:HAD superfamily hydrolase (TIGR01662 family)
MNKALFLDLDGTLIETRSGNTFPKDEKDWKFKSRVLGKIKQFFDQGYKLIVVTNQAGIDEGYATPLEFNLKVQNINDQISNFLRVSAGKYHCWQDQTDDVYWMVADYNEHPWRKPGPDAAFFAADKFNINLSKSVMVGDASGLIRLVEFEYQNCIVVQKNNKPYYRYCPYPGQEELEDYSDKLIKMFGS